MNKAIVCKFISIFFKKIENNLVKNNIDGNYYCEYLKIYV